MTTRIPTTLARGEHSAVDTSLRPPARAGDDLLLTLGLSGRYRAQVEAFYWRQRQLAKHLKVLQPKLTRRQAVRMLRRLFGGPYTHPQPQWQTIYRKRGLTTLYPLIEAGGMLA